MTTTMQLLNWVDTAFQGITNRCFLSVTHIGLCCPGCGVKACATEILIGIGSLCVSAYALISDTFTVLL